MKDYRHVEGHLGQPTVAEDMAIRLIHEGIDRGITFLDNSWDYNEGRSEIRVGKALAQSSYRQKAFVMTKIDGRTSEVAAAQIDTSLKRLQVDHIDLLQHHEVLRYDDPDRIFNEDGAMVEEALSRGAIEEKRFMCLVDSCQTWTLVQPGRTYQSCARCQSRYRFGEPRDIRMSVYPGEEVVFTRGEIPTIAASGTVDLFTTNILQRAWECMDWQHRRAIFDLASATEISASAMSRSINQEPGAIRAYSGHRVSLEWQSAHFETRTCLALAGMLASCNNVLSPFAGSARRSPNGCICPSPTIATTDMDARRLAPASIRRKLSALSSVFDYLCERNAVLENPVDGVKRPAQSSNEGNTPCPGRCAGAALLPTWVVASDFCGHGGLLRRSGEAR